MKTRLPFYVGAVLSLMLAAAMLMGVLWLPGVFTYLSAFLSGGVLLVFKVLCGVIGGVLFGILISAFTFPKAMAKEAIFTTKTAKRIKNISIALFVDSLFLCIAAVWLIGAGERLLMPALLFVALIGAMVASAVYILSGYIAHAAVLQEEVDGTL